MILRPFSYRQYLELVQSRHTLAEKGKSLIHDPLTGLPQAEQGLVEVLA